MLASDSLIDIIMYLDLGKIRGSISGLHLWGFLTKVHSNLNYCMLVAAAPPTIAVSNSVDVSWAAGRKI